MDLPNRFTEQYPRRTVEPRPRTLDITSLRCAIARIWTMLEKTAVCVMLVIILGGVPMSETNAQDPERLRLATELVKVMKVDRTLLSSLRPPPSNPAPGLAAADTAEKRLESYTKFREYIERTVGADGLVAGMAAIYANRFDATELEALLAFYRSPVGVRLVQEQPLITHEVQLMMQRLFTEHFPGFMRTQRKPPAP